VTRFLTSLTNRIFLASALLVVLSLSFAFIIVNATVTREAEGSLQRDLDESAQLLDQYRESAVRQLVQQAKIIADLPKLKAAVELDHAPTVRPLALDYQQQIDADVFVVTNREGSVLAGLGSGNVDESLIPRLPAIATALAHEETLSFWPDEERLIQMVTVPISIDLESPEVLGTLSVGLRLDGEFAQRFKGLTKSELAFRAGERFWAGTLPAEAAAGLADLSLGPGPIPRLTIGTEEFGASATVLTSTTREPNALARASAGAPTAIILRSRTERLRFLGSLRLALAATGVFALALATVVGYGVARTITRPLGTISSAMRQMASTGDLSPRIDPLVTGSWADEDAKVLASAFDTLTGALAAFQAEAAQRERLSSLGRLSTVLAHEIRNPLMIVKAAVRTLRRSGSGSDPDITRAAVDDIAEEVVRLNRLVDEVLDFAKPIPFTLGPVDLRVLCEGARTAALADGEGPDIRLTCASSDITITTDAERLRAVLVNLLVNARQAVHGALELEGRGGGAADPAIELTLHPRIESSIGIEVTDRGPGIAPEHLPRIFEPFFTTRRTGSGIGLAIARNVVEGLGGRITVTSTVGEGTRFTVVLPVDATIHVPAALMPRRRPATDQGAIHS
jgi:signal transduction histidine kinase